MGQKMHRTLKVIFLAAVLLCWSACLKWPSAGVSSKQPDKLLFERARSAAAQNHFTVANLTLQTLINTYPDSRYAKKAELILQDPRIAACNEPWSISPECDGRHASIPPTH